MLVKVRTLRFGELDIECDSGKEVSWLRKEVAVRLSIRSVNQIVLVCNGKAVLDRDSVLSLQGDLSAGSVLATVRPGQPNVAPQHLSQQAKPDEDDSQFLLPANASPTIKRAAYYLEKKLHIPGSLLALVFKVHTFALNAIGYHHVVRQRTWLFILLWLLGARLSHWLSLGPIYIIVTIAASIYLNLGQRQEGEASAYSIFNNFRALPGQLTGEQLDGQVRRGQF